MPLSHAQIWSALDRRAAREGLTPSSLARRADLDPTSFNPSKRMTDGRARWPSTESLTKVLSALGVSLGEFAALAEDAGRAEPGVPLLGFAQAGDDGFFDDGGFPAGQGWDVVEFPASPARKSGVYALEVQGESMMPLYRDGDVLIVEPGAQVRRSDRVVVKTREGEVMAKILMRQTAKTIELYSLNPEHPNRSLDLTEVEWMARIIWASQ